jgi:hypothetical protein
MLVSSYDTKRPLIAGSLTAVKIESWFDKIFVQGTLDRVQMLR